MSLFPKQYDMICELTRLENLMPSYSDILKKIGKVLRNKVWEQSDEKRLVRILAACNDTLEILVDVVGDNVEIAEFYVKMITKYERTFSHVHLEPLFNEVMGDIVQTRTKELYFDHWRQINPLYADEYENEDLYKKNIIQLIDEVMDEITKTCPDGFIIQENHFTHYIRGRRGSNRTAEDLYPPSIDIAKTNNIHNRWNPPDKRYLYLVAENGSIQDAEQVCLEELRIKSGDVTIAEFFIKDSAKEGKLLNLKYDSVSFSEIENEVDGALTRITQDDVDLLRSQMPLNLHETEVRIKEITASQKGDIRKLASAYCGKLFFKYLCDVIFLPLDKDEDVDADLKERCYKSFHILAQYLEDNGYAGIVYPSTRMMLINKNGTNVVLFNAEDAKADEKTLHVVSR